MPPKQDSGTQKGKPGGGGDGGGGGGGPNAIYGTPGNDVLRGTRGDDIFYAGTGNDEIDGRTGTDIVVIDGSVWEYDWKIWGGAWKVTKRYDGTNDKILHDVEILQFNDYTVVLGEEIPLEVLQAPPGELRVEAGGEGSFTFKLRDYDDLIDVTIVSDELAYGAMWVTPVIEGGIYGANGQQRSYEFHYDYDRYYNDYTDGPVEELALGEEYVLPVTLLVKTSNFWLDADDPDRGEYTELTFDLVIVGKNEAPEIAGTGSVEAIEDGGEVRFDLSGFGTDIDSDDDGSTLTYDVVGTTGGLDVRVEGHELVLSASTLIDTTTSDEFATGTITLRAVDRHGAVSEETITLSLKVTGIDDTPPPPDYLTAAGGIDYAAMGLETATVHDFGEAFVSAWTDPLEQIVELTSFTGGDDIRVIEAAALINYDDSALLRDGERVLDSTAFDMGDGDDTFVFRGESAGQAVLSFTDVFGGAGEDVVAISLKGGTEALFHGGLIDTGAQSDRVLVDIDYGVKAWWTADIDTGSGHDFVDIRIAPDGLQSGFAELVLNGGVDLGTGNDRLNLVVDDGDLSSFQFIDFAISGGAGDDHVTIDTSGLGAPATVSETQDPNGLFRELYPGGWEGGVYMGEGTDVLELNLSDADPLRPVTASLYGGPDDDTGVDTLILHHLSAGDATFETFDAGYLGTGVRITDGNQTLDIYDFEQILLGDGTDVFALV